jgi:hypothetical protein
MTAVDVVRSALAARCLNEVLTVVPPSGASDTALAAAELELGRSLSSLLKKA